MEVQTKTVRYDFPESMSPFHSIQPTDERYNFVPMLCFIGYQNIFVASNGEKSNTNETSVK